MHFRVVSFWGLVPGEDRGFPENVFITHNHLDHAGELPVFFYLEARRRFKEGLPKLRILCGPEVEEKIKTHRLNEMLSMYTPVRLSSIPQSVATPNWREKSYFTLTDEKTGSESRELWDSYLLVINSI